MSLYNDPHYAGDEASDELTLDQLKKTVALLKQTGPPPKGAVISQTANSVTVADGEGGMIAMVPREAIETIKLKLRPFPYRLMRHYRTYRGCGLDRIESFRSAWSIARCVRRGR